MSQSDLKSAVNRHYGRENLAQSIFDALRAAGKDPDHLTYSDLAPVDQFHSRGRDSTLEMARLANLQPGQQVLDVGGGLGGPARLLAAEFGVHVTVHDLTEDFCRVGEMLTRLVGLSNQVSFQAGNALDIPFPDASFDIAWTQHSSMNIENKERLYAEIHRILRPGGLLAIHEIVAGPVQPIHVPVPWASTHDISFLRPAGELRNLIAATGFRETAWLDVTPSSLDWFRQRRAAVAAGALPTANTNLLVRERAGHAFANQTLNLEENRTAIIMATFQRI
jgi:ubiquinone/menaquinone biosynthesis C-methylase UbiE